MDRLEVENSRTLAKLSDINVALKSDKQPRKQWIMDFLKEDP